MSVSENLATLITPAQIDALDLAMSEMMGRVGGAQAALLATSDGFPAASTGGLDRAMRSRIAAVVSSLCALSEAAGAQIDAGPLEIISLQFVDRQMQVVSLLGDRSDYALALVTRADVLMGSSLWAIGECANQIRQILRP
jgi:predicted regulator of Ras-like GTPase activity (Roadblock/LC7/MglB family)